MSYKALYRKYRPKTFQEVLGQNHIVATLENVIKSKKVSHAYLFAGPRGTGKTSVAHVFAREVNRNAANQITVSDLDIIEIDAASNNGVAEVRQIIDNSRYAPSEGKYKVYIIDEVHMLTKGAFNALLKTLEEPPVHVIFILATTEPHKIPITILSRIQRFNFRRIKDKIIIEQLKEVFRKENIQYDQESLKLISKLSNGGMRDALSIADQAAAFGNNNISFASISQVFGIVSFENQIKLFNLSYEGKAKEMLILSSEFIDNGVDIERLSSSLLDIIKDFIILKKTEDESLLLTLSKEEVSQLIISIDYAYEVLDILIKLSSDLRFSEVPRQSFELALLKTVKEKNKKIIKNTHWENNDDSKTKIFNTQEINGSNILINTDEMELSQEMVTNSQESQIEENKIEEDILSTQKLDLNNLEPPASSTEEIDLISMFSANNTQEIEAKKQMVSISVDEILNLLIHSSKEDIARKREIFSNISSFGQDVKSSSYCSILEKTKIIASGTGFVLFASRDENISKQIRRDSKRQSFIDFIAEVFNEPLFVTAISKEELDSISETYKELAGQNALPNPKPIPKVFVSKKQKSEEETFGENIFGDLFNS